MPPPPRRTGLVVTLLACGLSACGGGSTHSTGTVSQSSTPTTSAGGASRLEAALRASGGKQHPSSVSCRLETGVERGRSPFGNSGSAVYGCAITLGRVGATYDVQVLKNGCFVAERRRPGKAIYGCGAGRT